MKNYKKLVSAWSDREVTEVVRRFVEVIWWFDQGRQRTSRPFPLELGLAGAQHITKPYGVSHQKIRGSYNKINYSMLGPLF